MFIPLLGSLNDVVWRLESGQVHVVAAERRLAHVPAPGATRSDYPTHTHSSLLLRAHDKLVDV